MRDLLVVAAGGAVGAVLRYLTFALAVMVLGRGFPYGTLIVNVLGSFVMGVVAEAMSQAWALSQQLRVFLAVGILGAFTTFSTFSLDVAVLYERGRLGQAAGYVLTSVTCSIGALFLGLYLVRRGFSPMT